MYEHNGFGLMFDKGQKQLSTLSCDSSYSMKILLANRIAPDGTPRSAAFHLGLFCLPMSHKRDARLK